MNMSAQRIVPTRPDRCSPCTFRVCVEGEKGSGRFGVISANNRVLCRSPSYSFEFDNNDS